MERVRSGPTDVATSLLSRADSGLRRAPVLSIQDLVVEFAAASGPVRAVDGVSFDLYPGETLGVVGESGSGKTVTVLAALGLLPRRRIHRVSGRALLDGRDLLALSTKDLRQLLGRDIAMVFQDPIAALNPVQRVGEQIAEALLLHDASITSRAARRRAVELLDLVDVPEPDVRAQQYPHQFSGGMCQRAVIAMAIANRPRVLIADEPTTAVDVSVQAQLLEVLRVAHEETGAATVLITHDMGVIAETADRLCVMYAGRVVEAGDVPEVFAAPRHPYTSGLLNCIPRLDGEARRLTPIPGSPPDPSHIPAGCAFAPRCSLRAEREICVAVRPELTTWTGPGRSSGCHFATEVTPAPRVSSSDAAATQLDRQARHTAATTRAVDPLLSVEHLVKRFPIRRGALSRTEGWVHAVDDVSFVVSQGETLGLVGESGCGKSTTARLLLRLDEPTGGRVLLEGRDIARATRSELRRIRQTVQMVFQDPHASLNPRLSVGDNVAEPLRLAGGFSQRQRRERVGQLFEQVGLRRAYATRLPAEFSGGQRQRVAIARALALAPKLLLLDEPVSALDASVQAQVLNLLDDLKRDLGLAYLFVSHDLSVVRHVSDRVAVMYLGKIVEIGRKERVFANPRHPYTRALLASVPIPDPVGREDRRRVPLGGDLPSPANPPSGCRFRTRCPSATDLCATEEPALISRNGQADDLVACHYAGGGGSTANGDQARGGRGE